MPTFLVSFRLSVWRVSERVPDFSLWALLLGRVSESTCRLFWCEVSCCLPGGCWHLLPTFQVLFRRSVCWGVGEGFRLFYLDAWCRKVFADFFGGRCLTGFLPRGCGQSLQTFLVGDLVPTFCLAGYWRGLGFLLFPLDDLAREGVGKLCLTFSAGGVLPMFCRGFVGNYFPLFQRKVSFFPDLQFFLRRSLFF